MQGVGRGPELEQLIDRIGRTRRGGDDFDVADRVLAAAQRSDRLRPLDGRGRAKRGQERIGDSGGAAERQARHQRPKDRQRGGDARLDRRVEAGDAADLLRAHGGGEIGCRRRTGRSMDRAELLDRDRVRLVEPAEIGRQIRHGRFDQHPAAGLVHLPQPREGCSRPLVAWRRLEQRTEIGVRLDCVGANDRVGMRQQRFFGGIAADHGEPGEMPEGAGQRRNGCGAGVVRNRRASLSVPQVRAAPAWALLSFQSGGLRPANRQCRP